MRNTYKLSKRKPFLYLAAPLFSDAEKAFNEQLARMLGKFFVVYLPQRDGGLFRDLVRGGLSITVATERIFDMDTKALRRADFVLAVLDGRAIDEGVAVEVGYAFALNKSCYGIQTDSRRLLPEGNNPMIMGTLKRIFNSTESLHEYCYRIATRLDEIHGTALK